MKKLSLLTAISAAVSAASLLIIPSASFADHANYKADYKNEAPCPPEVMLKDGFYVGIGLGYDAYKVRRSASTTLGGVTYTSNPELSAKGWNGSLFAGYGQYFDYFYLGAELLANTSNADTAYGTGTVPSNYAKFDVRASYGVSLLPGVRLNNTSLLYVRLGYLRSDFKASESVNVPGVINTSYSDSEWKNGFNYGLGMETLVYDNVSLRGEYTYTQYSSFRGSPISKWDPSNNQFVLGLIYHFA